MNNQEVVERLDILISLMIPTFEPTKYELKGLAVEVLKLSDAEHSVEDMIKKLQKPRQAIDNALSKLRNKGLIRSITKNTKTFYVRLQ